MLCRIYRPTYLLAPRIGGNAKYPDKSPRYAQKDPFVKTLVHRSFSIVNGGGDTKIAIPEPEGASYSKSVRRAAGCGAPPRWSRGWLRRWRRGWWGKAAPVARTLSRAVPGTAIRELCGATSAEPCGNQRGGRGRSPIPSNKCAKARWGRRDPRGRRAAFRAPRLGRWQVGATGNAKGFPMVGPSQYDA
jgi:hypothetical protein